MRPGRFRFDIRQAGRQLLLVYLAVLAFALVFWFLFVRPRVLRYRSFVEESEPRVKIVQAREAEVKAREAFLTALERAQEDLKGLRKDILSTRDRRMTEAQFELDRLAKRFSVDAKSVQYENVRLEGEGLDRFAMIMPLAGGYANLRKFIEAVEASDKFLVIERVALGSNITGGPQLQLNITVATYFDLPDLDKTPQRRRPGEGRA